MPKSAPRFIGPDVYTALVTTVRPVKVYVLLTEDAKTHLTRKWRVYTDQGANTYLGMFQRFSIAAGNCWQDASPDKLKDGDLCQCRGELGTATLKEITNVSPVRENMVERVLSLLEPKHTTWSEPQIGSFLRKRCQDANAHELAAAIGIFTQERS